MDRSVESWSKTIAWAREVVGVDRVHLLQYRELVADRELEMRAVFRFLGVAPHVAATSMLKSMRAPLSEVLLDYARVRDELLVHAGGRWAEES